MTRGHAPADDELIYGIIEGMLDDVRSGRPPQLDEACQSHPLLADEIRKLWATAQLAENLSKVGDGNTWPMSAREAESAPPKQVGPFEIIDEIGRGGMGVVYKARQRGLGRTVALKMILRGDLASGQDRDRFRQEAEAAAHIDHPNIVPIYETGEIDGRLFFSMKHVEGTTLARRLADGPIPPREAATILLAVAEAMAEAHHRGILHRDLKPANILLDQQGQPHVTDFGLAKRFEGIVSLTQSGLLLGTPSYMAPEQAGFDRAEVGPAADIYSLGAILYQMLTGRPPFQAASPLDTIMMVLEHEPVPPRMFNRKADPDLELIAIKCLQKHPDLRYPSADELVEELRRYLANQPLSIRSVSWGQILNRLLRETHHAPLLENWGFLWMWNGVVLLAICLVTNTMQYFGIEQVLPYFVLWSLGLGTWASIFWQLRRQAGPIQFVERQVAHVWAASVLGAPLLYFLEITMGLPVLTLSPILALIGGIVFLVKASILVGSFYIQAVIFFLTAFLMALFPSFGVALFGAVACASFFIPGWKYYRQRLRVAHRQASEGLSGL